MSVPRRRGSAGLALVLCSALVAACGGGGGSSETTATQPGGGQLRLEKIGDFNRPTYIAVSGRIRVPG